MLNRPLRIYKYYQIVAQPIHIDLATKAIEFYLNDFSKSIPGEPQSNSKQTWWDKLVIVD